MDHRINSQKIVCLGGGVGTSNLLRGLKNITSNLTVITSMADDGGSSGRLRKAYDIMPPGDIIFCIAALIPEAQKELAELLLYRFEGENTDNKAIDGHKLGNLIMLAEIQRTGDFYKAIDVVKQMFSVHADLLPATDEHVQLSGITNDGRTVHSETTLDLALYSEPHGLKKIFITPEHPVVNNRVVESLMSADVIISGPGDLYTNQLPVLIVPEIIEALQVSKARKIFILNTANKPSETKNFTLCDYLQAINDHLGFVPFEQVIANNNTSSPIPSKYQYDYIRLDTDRLSKDFKTTLVQGDLVNEEFPLYHDSKKLADVLTKTL